MVAVLALTGCPKRVPEEEQHAAPPPPKEEVKHQPEPVPDIPGLIVHVEPQDAELIIDGVNHGMASRLETDHGVLPLKTGIYQVSLKRTGYVSWRAEVTVNDKPETLQVTLQKQ